jgi:hypothetical protein
VVLLNPAKFEAIGCLGLAAEREHALDNCHLKPAGASAWLTRLLAPEVARSNAMM